MMKKERKDQLKNLQNCQESLQKLRALKQLLQKIEEIRREWLDGEDAILAFSYEYLVAKLPKAEPYSQFPELFAEELVQNKIQKLIDIIHTKLRENEAQGIQDLAE